MDLKLADPKGLIRESYAIEGITPGECRSIFLDWALSLAPGIDVHEAMRFLIAHYGAARRGHPMTVTMAEADEAAPASGRRGGRAGRLDQKNGG